MNIKKYTQEDLIISKERSLSEVMGLILHFLDNQLICMIIRSEEQNWVLRFRELSLNEIRIPTTPINLHKGNKKLTFIPSNNHFSQLKFWFDYDNFYCTFSMMIDLFADKKQRNKICVPKLNQIFYKLSYVEDFVDNRYDYPHLIDQDIFQSNLSFTMNEFYKTKKYIHYFENTTTKKPSLEYIEQIEKLFSDLYSLSKDQNVPSIATGPIKINSNLTMRQIKFGGIPIFYESNLKRFKYINYDLFNILCTMFKENGLDTKLKTIITKKRIIGV